MSDNALHLAREGKALGLPDVTLAQAWQFCLSEYEAAKGIVIEHGATPLYLERAAVYGALLRLIDGCLESQIIKGELRSLAQERARDLKLVESTPVDEAAPA